MIPTQSIDSMLRVVLSKVGHRLITGVSVLGFQPLHQHARYTGIVDNESAQVSGKFAAHQYFPDVEHLWSLIFERWKPLMVMPSREKLIDKYGVVNFSA